MKHKCARQIKRPGFPGEPSVSSLTHHSSHFAPHVSAFHSTSAPSPNNYFAPTAFSISTMLVDTFLECCLRLLGSRHHNTPARNHELAKVISTLELLTANMAVALIFLHKYQSNSVNHLDTDECDTMAYYGIVAALVLANKVINDQSYTLKTWHNILVKFLLFLAPLPVLHQLEMNFLAGMNYLLNTKHDVLMWRGLEGINPVDVGQLRQTVDASCPVTPAPTPPTTSVVPPLVVTPSLAGVACAAVPCEALQLPSHFDFQPLHPSRSEVSTRLSRPGSLGGSANNVLLREATDLTYLSYNSTPVFAPVTPVSHLFAMATLPTPFSVAGGTPYKWEQPCKRRKMWNDPPNLAYLTN